MEGSPVIRHSGADSHGLRIQLIPRNLCFPGIYFPRMNKLAWVKVIAQNWRTIFRLTKEAIFGRRPEMRKRVDVPISSETLRWRAGKSRLSDLLAWDLAKGSSESLSPAELSILALPIRLGDVGWLQRDQFQPGDRFSQ